MRVYSGSPSPWNDDCFHRLDVHASKTNINRELQHHKTKAAGRGIHEQLVTNHGESTTVKKKHAKKKKTHAAAGTTRRLL